MNFTIKNLPDTYCDKVIGTSFFGVTIGTTVNELKDLFSYYKISPVHECADKSEKVSIEWWILVNDLDNNRKFAVTLYDYDHYNMADHPNEHYRFHIGSNSIEESEYFRTVMIQLFKQRGLDTECM